VLCGEPRLEFSMEAKNKSQMGFARLGEAHLTHVLSVVVRLRAWCMAGCAVLEVNNNNNNNNNNNPICKAPECQKTSVALADRNSRAN